MVIQIAYPPPTLPTTSGLSFWVATTGFDTNPGTFQSPFLTIQRAIVVGTSTLLAYFGLNNLVINVGVGTFPGAVATSGVLSSNANGTNGGPGVIQIKGAGSGLTTIGHTGPEAAAIIASDGATITLQNLRITSVNGGGIFPTKGARIGLVTDVVFGKCNFGLMHAELGGTIEITGGIIYVDGTGVVGNVAPAFIQPVLGGRIMFDENAMTINMVNNPTFGTAFADVRDLGLAYVPAAFITFAGAATGKRFSVQSNSVVETNGSNPATYFPGTIAGTTATGGQYL